MKTDSNYYVYAYFDPRNYEMLYVGKGRGSRKNAHVPNKLGSDKERQIHEIKRAGLEPLIRVVAAKLTEDQAYLVEKALIWKSGRSLKNVNSGRYAENFRPPDTLHLRLPGFDTARGIFFVNVGDGGHRMWEDGQKFGFVAAGYGTKYSSQLNRLSVGDIVAAYLSGSGYVGIGQVTGAAVPVADFRFKSRPLNRRMLTGPDLLHDIRDADTCEYLVAVRWKKKMPRDDARFRRKGGLFTTRQIVANLSTHLKTLEFLEKQFRVSFKKLLASK
jgi:hypothetical protein